MSHDVRHYNCAQMCESHAKCVRLGLSATINDRGVWTEEIEKKKFGGPSPGKITSKRPSWGKINFKRPSPEFFFLQVGLSEFFFLESGREFFFSPEKGCENFFSISSIINVRPLRDGSASSTSPKKGNSLQREAGGGGL